MPFDEIESVAQTVLDCDGFDRNDYEPIAFTRKQFFVRGLDRLTRGSGALEQQFRAFFEDRPDIRPPKGAVTAAFRREPITLDAACRLKRCLDILAQDASPAGEPLREAFTLDSAVGVVTLQTGSVVPSIYLPDRIKIRRAREKLGFTRLKAAQLVYGSAFSRNFHQYLFVHLEDGFIKNAKTGMRVEYRITMYLARAVYVALLPGFEVSEEPEVTWESIVTSLHTAGPREGHNTEALPITHGNLLAALGQAGEARSAA